MPRENGTAHNGDVVRPDHEFVPPKLQTLFHDDGYLVQFENDFRYRYTQFKKSLEAIENAEGTLLNFRCVKFRFSLMYLP